MAGDWIKVEHVTPDKPEVHRIAAALGLDPDSVFGKLMRIWIWADQQTEAGHANVTLSALQARNASAAKTTLDRVAHCPGLTDELIAVGWIDDSDGLLQFVNFDRHNGQTAKSRALASKRAAKARASRHAGVTPPSRSRHAPSVTQALTREEKRREENIHTHTGSDGQKWPEGWGECKPLCEAWASWVAHHDQQCRPLTAVQQQLQIMDLRRQVADPVEAARWVCAAVSGGWRRIGKPHEQPAPSQPGGVQQQRRRKASVDEMMGDA